MIMNITVLTIFPEVFESFFAMPLIKRAIEKKIATIDIVDIKPYAGGSFRHIDEMSCQKLIHYNIISYRQ